MTHLSAEVISVILLASMFLPNILDMYYNLRDAS